MRRSLVGVAAALVAAIAAGSPSLALQVKVSPATGSSFVQGEPIFIWIDYYNDSTEEVGIASRYMFGPDVVTIRNGDDEVLRCAFEAARRGPRGGNQVQRIRGKEHLVILANLLDSFNLRGVGDYSVQVSSANYKPELDLDKDHPIIPPSKLVQGRIESNRWGFTITPGSGKAYELAATDQKWGLFGLQHYAEEIAKEYPDSPYAPYAVIDQIEALLYAGGSGPEPLKDRLVSAQALVEAFRAGYSNSAFLNVGLIRYAERLLRVGENATAVKILRDVQMTASSEVARLYVIQLLQQASKAS